jgi:hypothetical protein
LVTLWAITGCALAGSNALSPADRQRVVTQSTMFIGLANDVPSAIAAYNTGAAVDINNVELNRAFVRRMVDLGAPEAAFAQAQTVEAQAPGDALVLAVISYSQAAAGDMPAALVNIVAAVDAGDTDPFVLRTAAQLAAWTAQKPKDLTIPGYVLDAIDEMAAAQSAKKVFSDAFAEAKTAYAELAAAEAQAAQTQPAGTGNNAADPAWGTIPLSASAAASAIDAADLSAGPAGAPADAQPGAPWGEFAPGVALAPLQGDVSFDEGYSASPPPAGETIVNVYNDYDYYYPVDSSDDCNWYPAQVVFLGHFRRHGLLVARCRHRDVVVDHARNLFLGDARNLFDRHANSTNNNVVIDRARRITAGQDHHLTATRTPRMLLADNHGSIVTSRIDPAPLLHGRPNSPAAPSGGIAQNVRPTPGGAIVTSPTTGGPGAAGQASRAGSRPPGTGPTGFQPTDAPRAPGRVGRAGDPFNPASGIRNPLLAETARGSVLGNAVPTAGTVGAGGLPHGPGPRGNGPAVPNARGDAPGLPIAANTPPVPGAAGRLPAPAPTAVRPTAANTTVTGLTGTARNTITNPVLAGEVRPGGRSGPPVATVTPLHTTVTPTPVSVAPRPTPAAAVAPIAPPPAPAARPTFNLPPPAARVEAPAPVARPTYTPPARPVHVESPAPVARPTYTPPPPPVERTYVAPPPPPARVEAPAPAPRAASPADTRDNSASSGGGHSSGGGGKH